MNKKKSNWTKEDPTKEDRGRFFWLCQNPRTKEESFHLGQIITDNCELEFIMFEGGLGYYLNINELHDNRLWYRIQDPPPLE